MPLFEMPERTSSKVKDKELIKKATKSRAVTPKISGGNSLLDKISAAQNLVDQHLGKFKDRYILIQDEDVLLDYIDVCIKNNVISIDTETTGLDPLLDEIAGICIYTPQMPGAYIPINHISYITKLKVAKQLDVNIVRICFEKLIEKAVDIIMFNANFDIRVLRNQVGLKGIYCNWDCYLAAKLLNENEEHHNLKYLHQKYVLEGKEDAFTFGDLFKGIPFTMVPLQTAVLYAAHDPEITYELYEYQKQYLRPDSEREDMRQIYWVFKNIEMPCVSVISKMEDNGIMLDMKYQQKLSDKYNIALQDKLNEVYDKIKKYGPEIEKYRAKMPNNLDNPINISSPTQLAILFYDIIGYEPIDKRKPRGTGEPILLKMQDPIANAILEYRTLEKLIGTYIDKLPNCVNPNDGRIHCKFNQYGAKTGRMSSSDPNLQNIPSHNKDIRKMFVASPGYVLMSSDFSQQEPKCLAALCRKQGDSQMYDTFMENKDLYSAIASKAFNVPYEECREFDDNGNKNPAEYKERRTQAKSILLGVLYGRGVNSIAEQLKCTPEKAQKIKDSVFQGFPAIKKFEQDSLSMGEELGYVTTVCGRKRRLPDLQLDEYEFEWINGTAPDDDLLDFDSDNEATDVPDRLVRQYLNKLNRANFRDRINIKKQAEQDGIRILDNGGKIAEAVRQTVNSRIQGSAADLTKLALVELDNNEELQRLGFRLLIPVHDEVIAECPEENVKACSKLLAQTMSHAAEKILEMPIKCDVEITKQWYGTPIDIDDGGVDNGN